MVTIWTVDNLGDHLSLILELGHRDLLGSYFRAKFTFPMYFNGNKICNLKAFYNKILFNMPNDYAYYDLFAKLIL